MKTDFHLHSTASDGRLTPTGLVESLVRAGVTWASLTDHDTLAGLGEAARAGARLGTEMTPGVELSVECLGEPVHLLGYGFDPGHPSITSWVASYRDDRRVRVERMMEKLTGAGIPFDASVLPASDHPGVVARPHLADAVVAAGGARDAAEVFERYLGDGCPCHVPLPPRTAAKAIRRLHEAGGIAVLAHPGDWTSHRVVTALIGAGLDGIEGLHPMHGDVLRDYYFRLADAAGLVVTGGSDFHGRHETDAQRLGTFVLPEPRLDLLRERLRTARDRIR